MTVPSDAIIADFQKASKLTGTFTRVAKRLNVTPSHVRQVAMGLRNSDRVMKALARERERIVGKSVERAA